MTTVPQNTLDEIKDLLKQLLEGQKLQKEYYSTEEVAKLLDRDPYTVREWCRAGRAKATKRDCGKGKAPQWKIARSEVIYLQEHGIRPLRKATIIDI
jgi:transposase